MLIKQAKGWAARAYWYDAKGERQNKYQSGFRTKAAAAAWEAEYIAEMTNRPEPPKALTLSDLQDAYLERLRLQDASPRTVEYYQRASATYLPQLGSTPVADITPLMVQQTVDGMRIRPDGYEYRSETVRGNYRALRAVLNYGVKMGVISMSPCKGIDLPRQQAHEAVIYTGEQLGELLSDLRDEMHPLYWPVSLCARYALRRGEAFGARWCDIDFAASVLNVRANLTATNGTPFLKRTKTKSSETTVALSAEFTEELRELQKARLAAGYMIIGSPAVEGVTPYADLDPREFICLDEHDMPFHPDHARGRLRRFQRDHGLPLSGWHDLRHSYGTLMAEAGVDVVTISKAMRHSGVAITSDQYIKSTTQIKRRATDAMDNIVKFPVASAKAR